MPPSVTPVTVTVTASPPAAITPNVAATRRRRRYTAHRALLSADEQAAVYGEVLAESTGLSGLSGQGTGPPAGGDVAQARSARGGEAAGATAARQGSAPGLLVRIVRLLIAQPPDSPYAPAPARSARTPFPAFRAP